MKNYGKSAKLLCLIVVADPIEIYANCQWNFSS